MPAGSSFSLDVPAGRISGRADGPEDAPCLVVLAHGAGGDMRSPFMDSVAAALARGGVRVLRFNFPYAEAQRRAPDRAAVLESAWRSALDRARTEARGRPVVAGGKSMGGRIASQVVAAGERVAGLVFLGYPLHPPGKPERMRAAHLREISAPMLFVEGTRDPFCPLPTLREVLAGLGARTTVEVVEGGDHSFKVPSSAGRSVAEAWEDVARRVALWVAELAPGPP